MMCYVIVCGPLCLFCYFMYFNMIVILHLFMIVSDCGWHCYCVWPISNVLYVCGTLCVLPCDVMLYGCDLPLSMTVYDCCWQGCLFVALFSRMLYACVWPFCLFCPCLL